MTIRTLYFCDTCGSYCKSDKICEKCEKEKRFMDNLPVFFKDGDKLTPANKAALKINQKE
jgi:recombinational DNA repair protein RecR